MLRLTQKKKMFRVDKIYENTEIPENLIAYLILYEDKILMHTYK